MLKFRNGQKGKGHRLAGIVLLVLGFFWFSHKAGWIPVHDGGSVLFWPLMTLIAGAILIFLPRRNKAEPEG